MRTFARRALQFIFKSPRNKRRPGTFLAGILAVLLLSAPASSAPDPDIAISLSRQTATVGDPVDLTVRLRYDTSLQIVAPVFGKTFGELEVLGDTVLSEGAIKDGQKVYERRVRLVAFRPGSLWTPPVSGELVDSVGFATLWRTDSLLLDIASVLGDTTNPDSMVIKGIKAQYEVPESTWIFWAISGVLLIAALIAWRWWRRRKQPVAPEAAVPDEPSWETAIHALDRLPGEVDPETDGGRQWYFRLSEILRRYLDERYDWSSMDETTSQILRRLPKAPFANGFRERAREFFLLADQVRYARSPARTGRPEVDRAWVREFVEATIPPPIASDAPVMGTPTPSDDSQPQEEVAV